MHVCTWRDVFMKRSNIQGMRVNNFCSITILLISTPFPAYFKRRFMLPILHWFHESICVQKWTIIYHYRLPKPTNLRLLSHNCDSRIALAHFSTCKHFRMHHQESITCRRFKELLGPMLHLDNRWKESVWYFRHSWVTKEVAGFIKKQFFIT